MAEQLPQLTKGLYWREEENIAWKFHVVYVGYYGPSIVLVNADNTIPFDEQFTLVAQSLLNSSYIFSTYNVMLGSLGNTIDIASPIALASYCDYLSFVSNSTIYL